MPAIRLTNFNIHWTGVDDSTPPGHVLALGTDHLGNFRLCLYQGNEPTDEGFCGSLLIPPDGSNSKTIAYGPRGGYVTSSGDEASMLARLAEAR
ncbi:hypothetical protein [Streptomyces triculaminicus]|uniref:hypothetical protein n=1 Tax=Streptomyces triculaminicus TaxID=2816232 RepID=UPI0037B9C52A